jgi:hypothetical protein
MKFTVLLIDVSCHWSMAPAMFAFFVLASLGFGQVSGLADLAGVY